MIEITDKQALQILAFLTHTVVIEDVSRKDTDVLIKSAEELTVFLAKKLNIENWDEKCINPGTLEVEKL